MKKYIKEYLPYIIILIVVILIKAFIVSPVRVIGDSMKSTLFDGDIMILDKISYKLKNIKRFDIIVIQTERTHIIKRVIGLPGDTIEIKDNLVYVNDKAINENYLDKGTITNDYNIKEYLGKEKVPNGYYFVLGDNREVSADSRSLGFIKKSDILGKASLTLFPFTRIGIKK